MFLNVSKMSIADDQLAALPKPLTKQLAAWNNEVDKQNEAGQKLMDEQSALGSPEKAVERHGRAAEFAQRTAALQSERLRLYSEGVALADKIVPILTRLRHEAREAIATTREEIRADLVRIGYEHLKTARVIPGGNARVKAAMDLASSRSDVLQSLEKWQRDTLDASRLLQETLQAPRGGALI